MTFRFLGTGTSVGVPQIGCTCRTCTSSDPRDRRRRCGAYVTGADGTAFLVDTPPELRLACIEYGIGRVDAVVLTHAHMDHVAGFDDVRRFNTINGRRVECDPASEGANGRPYRIEGRVMPCYAMRETEEAMHRIFPYISEKGGERGLFRPMVAFRNDDSFRVGGVSAERLRVEHGFPCCGYMFTSERGGRVVYISDCHELPSDTVAKAAGADVLVLNCLRVRPHPTHLDLASARAYIEAIAPKRAYLVHLCHDFTHEEWVDMLRGTCIEPAYDGLEIEVA